MEKSVGAFCSTSRYASPPTTYQLLSSNQGLNNMNSLERRRLVKGQVIDVKVAKAAVCASKRQRAEAAKSLRKAMAAQHFNQLRAAS
jgi:hypothetical protein